MEKSDCGAHNDDHGPGHDHHHRHDLREASRRSLILALTLTTTFMVIEVIGGIASGSLALIADAGHMLTDSAAIGLALFAMWAADRPPSTHRTFGLHRTEILAALINVLSLWVIVAWIFWEAFHRIGEEAHIKGGLMLIVGVAGLLINVLVAYILHRQSKHSLNVGGALQHVMADLMGSVAVVVSGVFVLSLSWHIVDPILSMVIGLLILMSSWNLMTEVFHVLIDGTPKQVDVPRLCAEIEDVEGVIFVHDVHVRTITSGYLTLTAHVLADPDYEGGIDFQLRLIRQIVGRYGITHSTVQLEHSVQSCDRENHHVAFLMANDKATRKKFSLIRFFSSLTGTLRRLASFTRSDDMKPLGYAKLRG
ncbi:cation diffusion facilitator family transporter [Candidatus Poriferisocius sp.]|uniref:cation diffusion facilitator family transporter n=1 Tax=Candidatus Poriferisocius sp. TaxID=3101276 RepID=UPI003B012276